MEQIEAVGCVPQLHESLGEPSCVVYPHSDTKGDTNRTDNPEGNDPRDVNWMSANEGCKQHDIDNEKHGQRDQKESVAANGMRALEPAGGGSEQDADTEQQDDGIGIERDQARGSARIGNRLEQRSGQDNSCHQSNQHRQAFPARQQQHRRKSRVEHHLVVQRPAYAERRTHRHHRAWLDRNRNEEQRADQLVDVQPSAVMKAQHNFKRGGQPIDRNDPDDATGDELPRGAGKSKVVVVSVRHDEAADDEEDPDAKETDVYRDLTGQRIGRSPFGLPQDCMRSNDQERRNGTQDLDRSKPVHHATASCKASL